MDEIDLDKNADLTDGETMDVDCNETVAVTVENDEEVPRELQDGEVFQLNGGGPITTDDGICSRLI